MDVSSETKPTRGELQPGEALCEHCTAKCCRYFALAIDTPATRKDFDYLRWYLMHERAAVFTEDETWYLLIHTPCRHLQADQRCGVYATRPQICRDYSTKDCEYDEHWVYQRYFETSEQLEEYVEAVLPRAPGQSIRTPQPAQLSALT